MGCIDLSVCLPTSQKIKLFDSLVGSILNFSAEIWGTHKATDIELVHTKFLPRILGVKKSTNLTALYGELGRLPLHIYRKIKLLKYWIKILKQEDSSLTKQLYLLLKTDVDLGHTYNRKNWAFEIKTILSDHGFNNIWNEQFTHDIPLDIIKQRIIDTYLQK